MDENKNRTPLAEEDRPLVDRVDERVDEKLKDRLAGTVDPRIDQRIDQRIDERIDERVQERLDNRTGQPVANRPDMNDRGDAFQRPQVTGEHPDERLMEERANRFARERAERLARERTEPDADMRARQLNDERLESERLEHERMEHDRMEHDRMERERLERERMERERMERERMERDRMVDERANRMADERADRMADERANRMVDDRPVVERTRPPMASRIIYWLLGVIEAVLAVRLLLRLVGANAANSIVSSIYSITDFLVAPFRGIVPDPPVAGLDVQTLVAMVAYAIIGFALAKLIDVLTPNRIR